MPFLGKSKSCSRIHRYLRDTMAKKTTFWKRWSKPYRLTILEELSFKERWEISISRFGVALTVGALVLVVAASVYALVAWTPLKEFVVPGYASENSRLRAIQAEMTADSAIRQLAIQEEYLEALSVLLQGDVVERSIEAPEEGGRSARYFQSKTPHFESSLTTNQIASTVPKTPPSRVPSGML